MQEVNEAQAFRKSNIKIFLTLTCPGLELELLPFLSLLWTKVKALVCQKISSHTTQRDRERVGPGPWYSVPQ